MCKLGIWIKQYMVANEPCQSSKLKVETLGTTYNLDIYSISKFDPRIYTRHFESI